MPIRPPVLTPRPAPTVSSQRQAARDKGRPPCCMRVLCPAPQVFTPWSPSTGGPHCGPCCTGGDWGTGTESRGDLLTLGPSPCQEHVAQSSSGQLGSQIDGTPASSLPPEDAFVSLTNSFHFRTPVRPVGGWGALPPCLDKESEAQSSGVAWPEPLGQKRVKAELRAPDSRAWLHLMTLTLPLSGADGVSSGPSPAGACVPLSGLDPSSACELLPLCPISRQLSTPSRCPWASNPQPGLSVP